MQRKKIILILSAILSAGWLQAQTEKGHFITGAATSMSLGTSNGNIMSLGFSNSTIKSDAGGFVEPASDKLTSININPRIGYFLANQLAVGLDISLAYMNQKSGTSSDESSQSLFSTGPFVRYYFTQGAVLPFGEINSGFGSLKFEDRVEEFPGLSGESTSSVFFWGAALGMGVPLGDMVTADAAFSYLYFQAKEKENNPDNVRTVSNTFGLRIGVTVFLGS